MELCLGLLRTGATTLMISCTKTGTIGETANTMTLINRTTSFEIIRNFWINENNLLQLWLTDYDSPNYKIRSFAIDFSATTFDVSLAANYVEHIVDPLDPTNHNIYSTGINIENTMVFWQINNKDFIVLDRLNCFETDNPLIPGRCLGCSVPAANQCTECQEPGFSLNPATSTPSSLYNGIESGYCVDLSCMAGTHPACISCTAPNICTGCDPASATPFLVGGTC